MNDLLLFWAKLGENIWPNEYHPVVSHLIDVGQVARRMWNDVAHKHIKQWVTERLGLGHNEEAAGAWLAFWVSAHDIGKVSPCFQFRDERTDALLQRLRDKGFNCPPSSKRHGDISTRVLANELAQAAKWPSVSKAVAHNVAVSVGGHHGIFPTDWMDMPGALANEKWVAARRDLLTVLARLFGVTNLPTPIPPRPCDQAVWMYLAGLTSAADWIGSNVAFFRPIGDATFLQHPFDECAYFQLADRNANDALKTLGWFGRDDVTTPISFKSLFPLISNPRPLQAAVARLVDQMNEPGLLIVEAPMGEGKTEAGWFAAANWDRRGGQGAYVALPTMATSNQMFGRVKTFLAADGEGKKNLMLQHGKAALNEKFDELKYEARIYDEEKGSSAVVAESWFAANKKHGLLAPYGVGTIDQVLLAVLQTKHVFVRLFGLAGKCVILDEVHAYDAYMTTLMERLLRWLAALGCRVVLLSATLPKDKRLALLRAYAGDEVQEAEGKPYPRVTSVTVGGVPEVMHVEADKTRAKTVNLGWVTEDQLIEQLKIALADGGCAAVIRNTVGLAQETYLRFCDALKDAGVTVELFHARFPFGRRKQIEDNVLKAYGRTDDDMMEGDRILSAPHRPKKSILVATQVIEQSLDLDFDVMVSDVAPIDLVLQRAGRLQRHNRSERSSGLNEPQVWLIEPKIADKGVPWFGKSEFVYARYVLLKSHVTLKAAAAIRLPDDLEGFVEQVYSAEQFAIPAGWEMAFEESERELKEEQDNKQLNALDVAISHPDQSPLEQQSQQLEEDNPEASKKIHAQTRDTDPSIQLIVVYRIEGFDFLDANGRDPFDENLAPDWHRLRQILDNEVIISHPGALRHFMDKPVPKGWRKCGMLRYHRVVRITSDGKSLTEDYFANQFIFLDNLSGIRFMTNS